MEEFRLILEQYGLWAIAFGAFFQGYVFVITAGILASKAIFRGTDIIAVAAVSSWAGHWFFYLMGYWFSYRREWFARTRFHKSIQALDSTVTSHPWTSVFLMQYGHGIRIVAAIAFGFFRIKPLWFAWAQALNCFVWATLLFLVGYFAGIGLYALPSGAHLPAVITVITLCIVLVISRKHWHNHANASEDADESCDNIPVLVEKESLP